MIQYKKLSDLDYCGMGRFLDEGASFSINKYNLPRPWEYIYANEKILLKVSQAGTMVAQSNPPKGTVIFNQEAIENNISPFFVWIKTDEEAFSNFPQPGIYPTFKDYEDYHCVFRPEAAEYRVKHQNLEVTTTITVGKDNPCVIMSVDIINKGENDKEIEIIPFWRPHNTSTEEGYHPYVSVFQSCVFFNDCATGMLVEGRAPDANPANRKYSMMLTDLQIKYSEASYRKFIGNGDISRPEIFKTGNWSVLNDKLHPIRDIHGENAITGNRTVAALNSGKVNIKAGQKKSFNVILKNVESYLFDDIEKSAKEATKYFDETEREKNLSLQRKVFSEWTSHFQIRTPDHCLNDYINNWLPLQLTWVSLLDRGHASGMRGTRDSAQDFSGILMFDTKYAKRILLDTFNCQRQDGSFLRQFSDSGPSGKHDERDYIDSGCWVLEFLYDYLRYSGDINIMNEECRWLESEEKSLVRNHAKRIFDYYLSDDNKGYHGMIKLRYGDWNDSFNRAGLKGIGESVMTSCQVVFICKLGEEIFSDEPKYCDYLRKEGNLLKNNIRKNALTEEGYLRGSFTDEKKWFFSEKDFDNVKRVNTAVNSWGIISGVIEESEQKRLLKEIEKLKGPCGYRLFYPPLGNPPCENAGRMATGDIAPGLSENGAVYNHGAQGFLLRALSCVKGGDMQLDVLRHIFSYDQDAHPIEKSLTAPYAVVNKWLETKDNIGEGGKPFLSGTISTVIRAVYDGICGFKPKIDCLEISPNIPKEFKSISYNAEFRSYKVAVLVERGEKYSLALNGRMIQNNCIPLDELSVTKENNITCIITHQ